MLKRVVAILIIVCSVLSTSQAQDTLPDFSVVERGKKVTVSWYNPFESIIQLNVQRSYDSSKYFRTVFSATSPGLPQNGFTENKQPNAKTYYRIFYVLEGGAYFFTPANLAIPDTEARNVNFDDVNISSAKTVNINSRGVPVARMPTVQFVRFKDSILRLTKDTLFAINDSIVELRRFIAKEAWKPSSFIYTNREGYLKITLFDAPRKKYRLKVFEENGSPVFEIKQIKDPLLTLDKSNFVHAGWFTFELFEDDVLKERNKFYLPKDF